MREYTSLNASLYSQKLFTLVFVNLPIILELGSGTLLCTQIVSKSCEMNIVFEGTYAFLGIMREDIHYLI